VQDHSGAVESKSDGKELAGSAVRKIWAGRHEFLRDFLED
jgi:hypothetical protein